MIRHACQAALLLAGTLAQAQHPTVVVRDAGPGPIGRYLSATLAKPDTRVVVTDTLTIAKDSTYPATVIVIGKRVNVRGTVRGDVVVVGGDLFLGPGGRIEGQGVAIGGGAYGSLLANARDGLASYRDFTFDADQAGNVIELRYREQYVGARRSIFELPSLYGLRVPAYDRSNGLSLPVGPSVNLGSASVDLVAVYRSQIGRVDPSVQVAMDVGRTLRLHGFAGRESRTNDEWISGPLSNSLNSLLSGHDERNWYRATGGWATVSRIFETPVVTSTYSVGGSFERASSARPGLDATSGPWSLLDPKNAEEGMLRDNPQIAGGDITSARAGAAYRWTAGNIKARLDVDLEIPVFISTSQRFVQSTVDGRIDFPTFGLQRYRLELHGVVTADSAPAQRFAYLGGPSSLPTVEPLLALGGDEVLFIESRYEIPIPAVQLPFVGSPTISFRHILGSAGIQTLPGLTQIIGVRAAVSFARVQWLMDTGTRKTKFNAGLSLSR